MADPPATRALGAGANTATCALGELQARGYSVTGSGGVMKAERSAIVLTADDTLQLLGLALLWERRGADATRPTDDEVAAMATLAGASPS